MNLNYLLNALVANDEEAANEAFAAIMQQKAEQAVNIAYDHFAESTIDMSEGVITHSKVEKLMGDTKTRNQAVEKVKQTFKCSHDEACKHVDAVINKSMKQESSELTEISKKTLGSYLKRAAGDARMRSRFGANAEHLTKEFKKENDYENTTRYANHVTNSRRKVSNRLAGIAKASQRLANEELECLDELSKSTLASYVTKAAKSATDLGASSIHKHKESERAFDHSTSDAAHKLSHEKYYDSVKDLQKSDKRLDNILKATKRLTKKTPKRKIANEEFGLDEEHIQELSKQTLQHYMVKAGTQAGGVGAASADAKKGAGTIMNRNPDKLKKLQDTVFNKRISGLVKAKSKLDAKYKIGEEFGLDEEQSTNDNGEE